MSKYTPGPWRATDFYGLSSFPHQIEADADRTVVAATMRSDDARLIAAAPDLLDALRAILDHPRTDDRGTIVFMPHEVAAARAAIAKAEGKDTEAEAEEAQRKRYLAVRDALVRGGHLP